MKLKYVIVLVTIIVSTTGFSQDEHFIDAFYLGYDKEVETYSFEDPDGVNIEFSKINSDVLKKYDLISQKYIDQAFRITYTVKELADDEDYSEEYSIIFLKPTELERNEDLDDEFEEE